MIMKKLIFLFAILAHLELAFSYKTKNKAMLKKLAHEIAGNDAESFATNQDAKDFTENEFNEIDDISVDVPEDKQEIEIMNEEIKNEPLFFGRRRRRRSSRRRRSWWTRRRRCSHALTRRRTGRCHKDKTNGCGGKGSKLRFPYQKTFKESCNKHDICYYCGQARGWTRSSCDKSMYNGFKKICSCKYKDWKAAGKIPCNAAAWVMYKAVRIFGSKYYQKKSPSWCHDSCVVGTGSPKLPLK
ncbi:uncharacterized protein LOC130637989 [Hydractinia symbiolongicarpus]|uniref:uncharacterized protein LOC130637989 n=1 Tax=Hydractinia symbiolongicarpus TaxID=13093 RepID=UPI00254E0AD0|nr:uncharacterized protein LOC130637989 [Hydractinia symbiolongicarpus]